MYTTHCSVCTVHCTLHSVGVGGRPEGNIGIVMSVGTVGGTCALSCLTDIDPQLIIYSLNARIHAGPAECGGDFERRLIWAGFLFLRKNVANQFSVTGVCCIFTISTRCRIDGRVTCLAARDLPEVPTPHSPTVPPQSRRRGRHLEDGVKKPAWIHRWYPRGPGRGSCSAPSPTRRPVPCTCCPARRNLWRPICALVVGRAFRSKQSAKDFEAV